MPEFINLHRHFRELNKNELKATDELPSWEDWLGRDSSLGWPAILKWQRVLLLAEAGSGKTAEMQAQAKRLRAEQKYAFFLPLEALVQGTVLEALSSKEDEAAFTSWQQDDNQAAWFFLDSVDELKLKDGSALKTALRKFGKEVNAGLTRAHIIISCRPSDWRVHADGRLFEENLPLPGRAEKNEKNEKNGNDMHVVTMLEMNHQQIELFAQHMGARFAPVLLIEIEQQNAWFFARRPLDLSGLINVWNKLGHLGTRMEQHDANIAIKLKDEPDRADQHLLNDDEVRHGAEQLALALILTRTRTIRSPELSVAPESMAGVLNPDDILSKWTVEQRQSLLRRALFDPATYGRIRFHHRSVQEFLAAQRLRALCAKGMSRKRLFKLLFAESYGEKVVIPSMRPVATWLALWDDAVCKELMQCEPEALLNGGDPGSLTLAARIKLLAAVVEKYGQGGWRGLQMTLEEKRRLAHRELAPTIRELWNKKSKSPEVNQLLLNLVEQGQISECADLMQLVALDAQRDDTQRVAAVSALISCGCKDIISVITAAMLDNGSRWSDEAVAALVIDLYPKFISINDLLILIRRNKLQNSSGGFAYALESIARTLDNASPDANQLRDQLASLIEHGLDKSSKFYSLRSQFSYITPALALLCTRQFALHKAHENAPLIRAAVIAAHFTDEQTDTGSLTELKKILDTNIALREAVFWAELAFMDQVSHNEDSHIRLIHVANNGLRQNLAEHDLPWLQKALADDKQPSYRAVALYACAKILQQQQSPMKEIKSQLLPLLKGDALLEEILEQRTRPYEPTDADIQLRQADELRKVERNRKQEEMRQDREGWFDALHTDPDTAFFPERALKTIENIFRYLDWHRQTKGKSQTAPGPLWFNLSEIPLVFGDDLAQRAVTYLKTLWRESTPILWSAKAPKERENTNGFWILALRGLEAETTEAAWMARLTPNEARIAARYALPFEHFIARHFIGDLAAAHPQEVEEIWSEELNAQLNVPSENYLPILSILTASTCDNRLKQLLVPHLIKFLEIIPISIQGAEWAHRLESILGIFNDPYLAAYHEKIASLCQHQYETAPGSPLFIIWLRGLFSFNPEQAVALLTNELTGKDDFTCNKAIQIFAELFSPHGLALHANILNIADPSRRVEVLGALIRLSYTYISPEQDQIREGGVVYTPDLRENAASARSTLLNILLDTPSAAAHRLLLELANEFDFSSFADRLRQLAYQRAATDAELSALSAFEVCTLSECYETPPHDRGSLFRVMMDRLEDLAHDIAHHDFTDRTTLCNIDLETDMRNTLALRLQRNDLYKIACESIVADEKRTDFSLYALSGNQKAVIELKLAHKWAVSQLEQALEAQLVGQYLRHDNCKAGCLLLTDNGAKRRWAQPGTLKMLTFVELITHLQALATTLERTHSIKLAVFGLSCTAPYLAPAHGKAKSH